MAIFDPFRWRRRRKRLALEAREEVQVLRRVHGDSAAAAARAKLAHPQLTTWRKTVLQAAIRELDPGRRGP